MICPTVLGVILIQARPASACETVAFEGFSSGFARAAVEETEFIPELESFQPSRFLPQSMDWPELPDHFHWQSKPTKVMQENQVFKLKIISDYSVLTSEAGRFSNPKYVMQIEKDSLVETNGIRSVYATIYKTNSPTKDTNDIVWNITTIDHGSSEKETQVNYSVTNVDLQRCYSSLRIGRTTEARLVYTCFLWGKQPHVVLWVLAAFSSIIYGLLPVINTILYIRNIRSGKRTGFVTRVNNTFMLSMKRTSLTGCALILLAGTGFFTFALLVAGSVYFYTLAFDQTLKNDSPSNTIFVNAGKHKYRN